MVPWGCPKDIGNNSSKIDIYILSQYIVMLMIIGFLAFTVKTGMKKC